MSNGIIFDIPSDGIRNDDNILIELTRDCDVECANDIFKAFQRIYFHCLNRLWTRQSK